MDLIEVRKYIADNNPQAAQDVAKRIKTAVTHLSDQPPMGRMGRVEGTRELVISDLPYIIPYRVKNNVIQILRVMHTSRKWPGKL
jgi:addiction module RelE/StbE family toxin